MTAHTLVRHANHPPAGAATVPPPDFEAKLRFLRSGAAHEDAVGPIEAIETHMSWVFLDAERVLKLKKPVRFPFLDFTTLAAREFDAREEVRLNERLAPKVYLGLRALQWDGERFTLLPPERLPAAGQTVDWVVVMRRLPEARMLHRLVAEQRVSAADVAALAGLLGRFYRHAMSLPVQPEEYIARFQREQAANREVLLRPQFAVRGAATALRRMDYALVEHAELLEERCARGRIVEGHGDLRAEHVCLVDPPVVIDCLEFNAQLREVDPFDELAFLGLECDMAGAPWIAPALVAGCAQLLGDRPPAALIRLYTAQRALLRARLAMAHLLDPAPRTPEKWAPIAQRCVDRALGALDALSRNGLNGRAPLGAQESIY